VSITINNNVVIFKMCFYCIISNMLTYYIREFKDHLRRQSRRRRIANTEIEKIVNKDFMNWFPRRVCIICVIRS